MQVQNACLNHMMKSFGVFNNWVAFMDVDEYFQLNSSHATAVETGKSSLLELLDAELAIPRALDGFLCHSLQFQMWQVLLPSATKESRVHRVDFVRRGRGARKRVWYASVAAACLQARRFEAGRRRCHLAAVFRCSS